MQNRYLLLFFYVLFACVSVTLSACDSATTLEDLNEPLLKDFDRETLTLETSDGRSLDFFIYVAQSDEEMKQGLMFVEDLPDETGMLFRYKRRRIGSMWMKNTLIPLDIIFIKSDGKISDIHENATPKSLKSLRSKRQVKGALELIGGSAKKYNIRVGDKIRHEHFGTQ
ncbi:MAG: DUF192 domain-containing protein [Gammaproteobacteria bacterium]